MFKENAKEEHKLTRRTYGIHLTSIDIFLKFIFPWIKDVLYNYTWVDLFAGEGNLILPILNYINPSERVNFFKNHIYLSEIHPNMLKGCIENAKNYGIPLEIAKSNIILRDNLDSYPSSNLRKVSFPLFHITNPPYLYLGYIRKHGETKGYLKYFKGNNEGYQDLYQIAMINDLRNNVQDLIYIIPSNFLFGASVSNKIRLTFLENYKILKMIIFEDKIFEFTGTNICIAFFKKKEKKTSELQTFIGLKFKKNFEKSEKSYVLAPLYKYRAGSEFYAFMKAYKIHQHLIVRYYLQMNDIDKNLGFEKIKLIDANVYQKNRYKIIEMSVNANLKKKILNNILYVRTIDSGKEEGRAGLGIIEEDFNVEGILVSKSTYRTHPIQIFLFPELNEKDQLLLKNYVNIILEYFREKLDSEFLTTYKYSNANYTRKYLGLNQVKGIIETFPINLETDKKNNFKRIIFKKDMRQLFNFLSTNLNTCQ